MLGELELQDERPAYVRFELRPLEDKKATLKAGYSISKDIEYALITPPYSKDEVVHKVTRWLEIINKNARDGRIKPEWRDQYVKSLEMWREGQEAPVDGVDIKNWSAISPAQVKNLLAVGMRTVEDLAQANDQGLRRLGMGGMALKQKAVTYLKASKDTGPVVMENAQLKSENDQLRGTIDSLQTQLEKLSGDVHSLKSDRLSVDESNENGISASDLSDDTPVDKPSVDPDLAAARELYFEKFNKKAHPMKTVKTIMEAIG